MKVRNLKGLIEKTTETHPRTKKNEKKRRKETEDKRPTEQVSMQGTAEEVLGAQVHRHLVHLHLPDAALKVSRNSCRVCHFTDVRMTSQVELLTRVDVTEVSL